MKERKFESRLIIVLIVTVAIVFVFNIEDANATSTTTIIHNYVATNGRECFSGGNGGGDKICAEPFPNLPVGHRVTSLGFESPGVFGGSQSRMYLYDSDGILWHQKQTVTYTGSSLATQFFYFAEKVNVPANSPIINVGYSVTGSNHPFSSIAIYDDSGGSPHNQLANIGYIVSTGVVTVPMTSVINTPANGIVWLVAQESLGTWDGLDNGASNIANALVVQSFADCSSGKCAYPNPWTGGISTTKAPYISITVGDYTISGMAGTRINGTGFVNDGGGVVATASLVNATFIKSSTLWMAITSTSAAADAVTFYENSTSSTTTKVLAVPQSANDFGHTFGTPINEVNYTSAPYMQISYSNTDLKLSPTFGKIGTTVTATGANFTSASVSQTIKKNNETSFQGWDGHVFLQKFTGLTSSGKVTGVGYFAQTPHGNVRVKVYDDNGIFQHQANQTHVLNSAADNEMNTLYAEKFTGLPAGKTINSVWTWVQSGASGGSYSGAVYDDNAGVPNNLLGSGSASSGNGLIKISVTPITIPSNGIVWVALNTNDAGAKVFDNSVTQVAGTSYFHAQTCCSVPNPFGAGSSRAFGPYMVLQYNDLNNTGAPLNLLGESGSSVVGSGKRSVAVTATIPSSGNVWAGFEFDDPSNSLLFNQTGVKSGTMVLETHAFGTGPSIFSLTNYTQTLWISLNTTGSDPITLKFDGSTLTTNPTTVQADQNGAFSGITFSVPNSSAGSHRVNASDTGGNWAVATFLMNATNTVQFRPTLSDNTTMLTSAKVFVTNGSGTFSQLANNTGWVKFTGMSGNQNFTVFDDKNFESLKLINYNVQSSITKNLSTYDYAINCIGYYSGYQSDFIIRINDTDGTYITNISKPDCTSLTDMIFSMTFSPLGKSGNSFSTSMLTSIGNIAYQANAKQFTVNGNNVTTIFTGNTNLISNPFAIGSGLVSHTVNFDIKLGATQTVTPTPTGPTGPNPNNPPPTCTDPLGCSGQQCSYGINPDGTCFDPTCLEGENCNHLQCPPNSTLYNNECLATQPQVCSDGSLPVNGVCNTGTPQCPANTILINGACVDTSNQLCPDGSAPVNGLCPTGPLQCDAGTTLLNGECVKVQNPNTCLLGVNPDGSCITSYQQDQCTANPLLCLLGGGGAGGKDVTVNGITYTPTVDIVQLGQIKNEVIGVSWDSSSNLVIGGLFFSGNASFGFSPTPQAPYNLTGSTISQSSSGQIKYVLTVPSSYCSNTITTNCLNPNVSTFVVPVSITAVLDDKEVRNTIFLKITVLTQQTIATYLILGLALFAIFAIILSRRKDKKKSKGRRNVQVKSYKNNRQYLSKR